MSGLAEVLRFAQNDDLGFAQNDDLGFAQNDDLGFAQNDDLRFANKYAFCNAHPATSPGRRVDVQVRSSFGCMAKIDVAAIVKSLPSCLGMHPWQQEKPMDTTTQTKSDAQDKTAYQTPELIDYGSVDVVTQAVSGANTDQLGGSGPT